MLIMTESLFLWDFDGWEGLVVVMWLLELGISP